MSPEPDRRVKGLLLMGCGYSALRIARIAVSESVPVWGTTRNPARVADIEAVGAQALLFGAGDTLPGDVVASIDTVVDSAGPPWSGGDDPTPSLLAALAESAVERFVYLSSTSVYGDHGGAWVDEDSETQPASPAGKRRLTAERTVAEWGERTGTRTVIARLPGIYGPGRSILDRFRRGRFRWVAGLVPYSNRVHVDDLARGVWAACKHPEPRPIYLIGDGAPARLDEIGRYAAELLGVPFPEGLTEEVARSTIGDNAIAMLTHSKRLRNARMVEHLRVKPLYPSYREGLRAVLEAELPTKP